MNLFLPIVGSYAHFIEPRRVQISHKKIPLPKLPQSLEGFRIVHLSDIHFGPTNHAHDYLEKCIRMVNDLSADIVVMTGDFMQWSSSFAQELAQILSKMNTRLGIFASLGNHDYGVCHAGHPPTDPVDHEEVIKELELAGIRVLHNEQVQIQKGDEALSIVGLGDFWTPYFNPKEGFKSTSTSTTILLSHNPDSVFSVLHYPFDLMLAGHVHGGQISFPLIGPLTVPVKHRHLRRGLHRIKDRWLYTNRGLGYIFKARFLSRPEIACLDLVRTS